MLSSIDQNIDIYIHIIFHLKPSCTISFHRTSTIQHLEFQQIEFHLVADIAERSATFADHVSAGLQTSAAAAEREDRADEALGGGAIEAIATAKPTATAIIVADRAANGLAGQSPQSSLGVEVSNATDGRAVVDDNRGHGRRGEGDETLSGERVARFQTERQAATGLLQRSAGNRPRSRRLQREINVLRQ